jgi:hypothetical protein
MIGVKLYSPFNNIFTFLNYIQQNTR